MITAFNHGIKIDFLMKFSKQNFKKFDSGLLGPILFQNSVKQHNIFKDICLRTIDIIH